jgi:predicted enzyme related to lactoylglutathione lyase
MTTPAKAKARPRKANPVAANIVWFEIPADNVERARTFYSALFGWKIKQFPGMPDYWHIDTGGGDDTPDGGLMKRRHPHQLITSYVSVASVDKSAAKVEKLGGKICVPKTAVPQMGYFAVCQDEENNTFALWERNEEAGL